MDTKDCFIQITPSDNVAVALSDVDSGYKVAISGKEYMVKEKIPFGHKIALYDIETDDDIIKYGSPIGHATKPIKAGEWVHTHNTNTNLEGLLSYKYSPAPKNEIDVKDCRDTFEGYVR